MLNRIKRWLEAPQFEGDEEKTSQARIANTLIVTLGGALLVAIFILIPFFAFQKIGSWVVSITMLGGLILGRHLIARGRFQLGGMLVFTLINICILALLILSGGSSSTAMFYFAAAVLVAGFFLEGRVVTWLTLATFLIAVVFLFLQERRLVVIPQVFVFNSVFSWFATGLGLLFMLRTRDLFVGNFRNSLILARQKNIASQQAEARFRAIAENSSDGIVFIDAERKILYVSPAYKQLLGFDPEEMMGHFGPEFIHPEDREFTAQTFAELIQIPNRIEKIEYRLRRKDGSYCWVETTTTNFLDNPDVRSIVLNQRDITERKLAEEKLRQSEERYRTLFEQASDGIFYLSIDGKLMAVNESLARMHGYKVEEMQGMDLQRLDTPENVLQIPDRMRRVMAGESIEFETEHYHKDGHTFPLSVSTGLISVGGQQLIQAFHHDITGRKHGENELRESKALLLGAFNNSPLLMTISDLATGKYLEVNDSYCRVSEFSREESIGRTSIELGWLGKEERAKMVGALQKDGKVTGLELTLHSKSGKTVICRYSGNVIQTPLGNKLLSTAEDITERKHAQQALQESEKKYHELFRVNKDGIAIFQLDRNGVPGVFVELNDAAPKMLGYTRQEMLKLTPIMLEPQLTREELQARQAELKLHGIVNFETVLQHQNGHAILTEFTAQVIQYNGQPAVMNIVRDITERKIAEEKIQQQLAELQSWYAVTMERETRTLELKQEVNELLQRLDEPARYASADPAE
jgi:PAS domain S-box-containing protein